MFHFSKDRLAGLDNIILKISLPSKVPPVIPNCPISHEPYPEVEKKTRRKSRVVARVALGDKTNSNSVPTITTPEGKPEDPALLAAPCYKPCKLDESPGMKAALDDDCYRPLPPLPSASPLKLPSFLDLSTTPSTSSTQTRSQGPASSVPTAVLIRPTPISSRKRLARKSKKEANIGPHWIPAFHHPNSPYVPWTSSVRERILPPPSPTSIPPAGESLCSRSGAVAPEPWASSTFSVGPREVPTTTRVAKSWLSIRHNIKNRIKKVAACLGMAKKASKEPPETQHTVPSSCAKRPSIAPETTQMQKPDRLEDDDPAYCASLVPFASSDSVALASWLVERCGTATGVPCRDTPRGMSIEEYELIGSWLDLCQGEHQWVCGHQGCDLHLPDGSPNAMCGHMKVFRAVMPFSGDDLCRMVTQPITSLAILSAESLIVPSRFCSLPRLPSQSFDMTLVSCHARNKCGMTDAERCLPGKKSREFSMPGGWTFC
ncbi:hypothetical protein EV401DRAFT_1909134 [Pisolithus croceorrhizus]|nr:hypothetical protein EV401DRAFT_1909134 [Pisolithus croceorrhizus]